MEDLVLAYMGHAAPDAPNGNHRPALEVLR
jgi:hypothetical protein